MKRLLVLFLMLVLAAPAFAVDTKVTELTADTAPTSDDLIMTVNSPGGSPANRKVTIGNLFASPAAIGATTPAAGTFTTLSGGAAGFAVDADGDTTVKSITVTRVAGSASAADFYEVPANGDSKVTLKSADSLAADYVVTLPSATGTLPLNDQTMYIGTTSTAINRTSAAQTLAGITLTTPVIGAATGTSLIVTGVVDGLTHIETADGKTIDKLSAYYVVDGTTAFVVPTPSAAGGNQYCFKNKVNETNVITVIPVHTSGVALQNTANTAYCTADDKLVSGGAATDKLCIVALDATHYETFSFTGTWTCTSH